MRGEASDPTGKRPGDLLDHDGAEQKVAAAAAVLFGSARQQQPCGARLAPQLARYQALALPLGVKGGDLVSDEACHAGAVKLMVGVEHGARGRWGGIGRLGHARFFHVTGGRRGLWVARQCAMRCVLSQYCALTRRLSSLPDSARGSVCTKSTLRGHLMEEMRSRQ